MTFALVFQWTLQHKSCRNQSRFKWHLNEDFALMAVLKTEGPLEPEQVL